jgi:hypothetical protein
VQIGPNLGFEKLPEAGVNDFIQKARAWGIDLELGSRGLDEAHLWSSHLDARDFPRVRLEYP